MILKFYVIFGVAIIFNRLAVAEETTAIPLTDRIKGGNFVERGEVPWQASVQVNSEQVCGGSIIHKRWILTAAHCVYDGYDVRNAADVTVYVGLLRLDGKDDEDVETLTVDRVVVHEQYQDFQQGFDIALIRVSKDMTFNFVVKPVRLPEQDIPAGTTCIVTGWGLTDGDHEQSYDLLKSELQIVDQALCCEQICIYTEGDVHLIDEMLCAGSASGVEGTCQGDSGGPLVGKSTSGAWTLFGVTSFGIRDCIQQNIAGVFTRTARFVDWIQTTMAKSECITQ